MEIHSISLLTSCAVAFQAVLLLHARLVLLALAHKVWRPHGAFRHQHTLPSQAERAHPLQLLLFLQHAKMRAEMPHTASFPTVCHD